MNPLVRALVRWCGLCLVFGLVLAVPSTVRAADILGIHILSTNELEKADDLLQSERTKDQWSYVTIPFTLDDVSKYEQWQRFFYDARQRKIQPIVRLVTKANGPTWTVPTRKDITSMFDALTYLDWPQPEERLVVVFNEPNHKNEWGGYIDPSEYADMLQFAADWMHSTNKNFKVLPAGLDLAAPNGPTTMEAFTYLDKMLEGHERLLDSLDGWTSHSYPNPAFSAAPTMKGQNSLYGFEYELAYLKKHTDKEFPVYITETGWVDNNKTSKWLSSYYDYAVKNIWTDPRIRAVTPFLLQGSPGAFSGFSFLDERGLPTKQYEAYKKALEKQN